MKIAIKIGTALLSSNGKPNKTFIKKKVNEITKLISQGHKIILISSGSVAFGMQSEKILQRPQNTFELQLLSGEGQARLTELYRKLFSQKKIRVAQVLLTHHNFDNETEKKTITKIISEYQERGIVPIINENDLVSKEEFSHEGYFSDNDILSAIIAKETKQDLLILLTNVNGVYDKNPQQYTNARLMKTIKEPTKDLLDRIDKSTSSQGTGGMHSKLRAATIFKNETIIANGKFSLQEIVDNNCLQTRITY